MGVEIDEEQDRTGWNGLTDANLEGRRVGKRKGDG